jgi:hypothetical protein
LVIGWLGPLARSLVPSAAYLANATSTSYSAGISCHSAARVRSIIFQSLEDRIRVERYLAFLVDHADGGHPHPDIQSGKLFHGLASVGACGATTR